MTDSLGSARLDIIVDTTEYTAAIERARSLGNSFGNDVQVAFDKTSGSVKRASTSLLRWTELLGRSADEQKLLNAAFRGVPIEIIDAARNKLRQLREEETLAAAAARDMAEAQRQAVEFDIAGKKAIENDRIREQERVVAALTAQFHALEAAERQASEFSLAAQKAQENDFLREQNRVVAALTARMHELEAAEAQQREFDIAGKTAAESDALREKQRVVQVLTQRFHELEAAEQAEAQQRKQGDDFVAALQRQATAIGKTRSELLQMQAAELGVSDAAAPFIAKLREQERVVERNITKFNQYGKSAKEVEMALRGVPAQVTDIFVSLQGGSNPLTVFLQQGGQLRDMFGGIGPAAQAMGNALLKLINPFTLSLAAVGLFTAGVISAENRVNELNAALIFTGQASRQSVEGIGALASKLDDIDGVTFGDASEAIREIIATGKIAAENQAMVAEAAVKMRNVTGKAIKETVAEYADLARNPTEAVLRLNETENFLTQAVYERIRALQESGQIEEAAALATEARAEEQSRRADEAVEKMGLVTGAWHGIKVGIGEAWDEQKKFFDDLDHDAADAVKTLGAMWEAFKTGGPAGAFAMHAALNDTADASDNAAQGVKKVNSEVQRQLDAIVAGNRTRAEAQKLEEDRITNLGTAAGYSTEKINELIAASRKKFDEQSPKNSGQSLFNAETRAGLQDFKDALTQEQNAIRNSTQVLSAEYSAKLVAAEDYFARSKELALKDTAAQEKALTGQIGFLRSRNATGKEAVDINRQIGELEAQLTKVRADSAASMKVLGIQEQNFYTDRQNAIDAYRSAIDISTKALEDGYAAQVTRITTGAKEFERQQALNKIYRDGALELRKLNEQLARKEIDQKTFDANSDSVRQGMDAAVTATEQGFADIDAAQSNWFNGLRSGLTDWIDDARDVASQISAITKNSLNEAAAALTNYANTGKFQIKDMLSSIAKDISAFFMKQAVLQFAEMLSGLIGGGSQTTTSTQLGNNFDNFKFNAKGGVYDSPALSQYSNKVYSTPQYFAFAKGGVFAEDGEEAIMPLKRGSDGTLGVRMYGGGGGMGGGASIMLHVETHYHEGSGQSEVKTRSEGENNDAARMLTDRIRSITNEELQRATRPGGYLWRQGVSA